MSDANGKDRILEQGTIVAGNETIHAKLLKLLKAAGANATPKAKAASAN
jgi:hypothetical protein